MSTRDMGDLTTILDSLPDSRAGNPGHRWTPDEDEVIRKYWKVKRQTDIASVLGISLNVCRNRARHLGVAK